MNKVYEVLDSAGLGLGLFACTYQYAIPREFNGFQVLETFVDGSKTYLVAAENPTIAKRKVLSRQLAA